ncbi:hypothetical protein ACF0H5_000476 [Mactra antiquata]
MNIQLCHVCAILLTCIPGVSCYDYNVVGLVISSLVAFFLIIPIIVMIFMLVQWRDWYLDKKTKEGRIKMPRDEWYIFPRKTKRKTQTLVSTPKSERRVLRMQNVYQPDSRTTTLSLPHDQQQVVMVPVPHPDSKFEEKTQTLQLEGEEEPVIVADLLPDNQQQLHYRNPHVQDVVITSRHDEQIIGGGRPSSYTVSQQPDSDGNTLYVSINQDTSPKYVSQTVPTRTVEHKPYHVQLTSVPYAGSSLSQTMVPPTTTAEVTRLSQTVTAPSRQVGDVVEQNGATDRKSPVEENIAVYDFGDDNEDDKVAPTEQAEDVVLF